MQAAVIVLAIFSCSSFAEAAEPAVKLITCAEQTFPSRLESEVLAEINRARQSPRQYADTIREIFGGMDTTGVYPRGIRRVATVEGRVAVDEGERWMRACRGGCRACALDHRPTNGLA